MQLTVRQPSASEDAKHYTTERLRSEYLIETVFAPDDAILTYSHFDRIIAGGVMPVSKSVELSAGRRRSRSSSGRTRVSANPSARTSRCFGASCSARS